MSNLLLIDGDIVAHRVAWTCERTKYLTSFYTGHNTINGDLCCEEHEDSQAAKAWAEQVDNEGKGPVHIWSRKEVEPEEKAISVLNQVMTDICARYRESTAAVFAYLSPSVGNFRDQIATRAKYKGNRDSAARPKHLSAIRQHLVSKWGATEAVGQEADDELGIAATANPGSVIVSIDKDLKQIPGLHYDWVKKEETAVSKKEGDLNFFLQVLTGDKTDNVPGIAGVGPVGAAKVLEGAKGRKECWTRIVDRYVEEYGGHGIGHALETAQLVWIRRESGKGFEPPV